MAVSRAGTGRAAWIAHPFYRSHSAKAICDAMGQAAAADIERLRMDPARCAGILETICEGPGIGLHGADDSDGTPKEMG